jgi:flagellar biogenesis protein FliO
MNFLILFFIILTIMLVVWLFKKALQYRSDPDLE